MAVHLTEALRNTSRIAAIQIPITDWKADRLEGWPVVLNYVADVRRRLREHNLAKGDKIPTQINLNGDGTVHESLRLQLRPDTGGQKQSMSDEGIIYNLHLPLPPHLLQQPTVVDTVVGALKLIAKPYPGGNVPNMVRNLAQFLEAGYGPEQLELFSPAEPFFCGWLDGRSSKVAEHVTWTRLNLEHRTALHLPYRKEDGIGIGTLAFVTPSSSTHEAVKPHLATLVACDHVITSEGIGALVGGQQEHRAKLLQLLNPSSGWRPQCALDALTLRQAQHGGMGRTPIVSMNGEEMDEFIRFMEAQKTDSSFKDLPEVVFFSPFLGNSTDLNKQALTEANRGFSRYFQCLPPDTSKPLQFPVSISLGSEGGYHAACIEQKKYICFATTPSEAGAKKMIDLLGNQTRIAWGKKRTMGAGDAVATVMSLVNTWDMEKLMRAYARKNDPQPEKFTRIAAIIFTSLFSRLVGEYVFHSDQCDLSDIPSEKISLLIEQTVQLALKHTRTMWNATGKPQTLHVPEWGVRVVLWEFGE